MIVRLKEKLGLEEKTKTKIFQFYDSPIKRKDLRCYDEKVVREFQFYDSPIKRPTQGRWWLG